MSVEIGEVTAVFIGVGACNIRAKQDEATGLWSGAIYPSRSKKATVPWIETKPAFKSKREAFRQMRILRDACIEHVESVKSGATP